MPWKCLTRRIIFLYIYISNSGLKITFFTRDIDRSSLCQNQGSSCSDQKLWTSISVGNHVIFVMIHCTERWRRFAPDRILSKGKQHFLSVFYFFIQRVPFSSPHFSGSNDTRILSKRSILSAKTLSQNLMRRRSRLKYRDYLHGRQIVFIILSAWRVFRSQIRRQIKPLESQIPKISISFTWNHLAAENFKN